MAKRRRILTLGIIASALFGFSAIKAGKTATLANSLNENKAQASASAEAATCCPERFGICVVGQWQYADHRAYDGGGPCH